jgi:hypothetical protein
MCRAQAIPAAAPVAESATTPGLTRVQLPADIRAMHPVFADHLFYYRPGDPPPAGISYTKIEFPTNATGS